jgi:hypothetical protein
MFTWVELATWDEDKSKLTDRGDRPWDNPARRPSHADRKRAISREMLRKQFLAALPDIPDRHKLRTLFDRLIAFAV